MSKELAFAELWEKITDLTDMVLDRDVGDAVALGKVLHEVAKLHVAGQLPTPTFLHCTDYSQGYLFSGDEIRKFHNLFRALNIPCEVDDDGIPL